MLFTEEHDALRENVRQFIEKEINPHVETWEREGMFPAHDIFRKMGELDLLGITKPEKFGGLGLDYSFGVAFAEELGTIRCGALPMAIGVQTDMATPALARFGSDEVRREFLEPSISGEYVACIGVSEPHAGSDVAAIKTTAKKDGGDYVINGTKMWITNATQADWVCLLVNTSDGPSHKNKSLIAVPLKTDGVTFSTKLDKLGMRSSDTAQIFFDNVRVPQRFLIGEEGHGFKYQMIQFQEERMFAAASILKGLEWVVLDTIEYARQRKAFGQPILDNQSIHFRLGELATEIEALRSLVYRCCECYLSGQDVTLLASMAKLKSGRLAREVTDACLQYWGGMGFMWETPVTRAYRDMRLISIGGGTDEVMLGIIGKLMGLIPPGGR
ncbi:Acyl-CoA dehydrogenase family protein [Sulfidibacter corallicola]|uniref:Acyl-CoA dehydrogenase family protein n=1 Tax=Sulfidibacter corallicola TaxID=2818388 RepID=A0A8A4TL85_SULCO|nr:acyl-CoA dehydrogenase family protein [Sulfidibacter corallicola]QTD49882.1 acyl-CoA dehydrogenase family protein [Sulfidibacter corallicola]